MLTIPYETVLASIVASAAIGATIATWVLRTIVIENRVLAARIARWENRVSESLRERHSNQDALPAAPRRRLRARIRMRITGFTERLFSLTRRRYEGAHKLARNAVAVRRWHAGYPAGWVPSAPMVRRLAIEAGPASMALARWEDDDGR